MVFQISLHLKPVRCRLLLVIKPTDYTITNILLSLVSFYHVLLMSYKQYAGFLFSSSVDLKSNFAIMQNNKGGH